MVLYLISASARCLNFFFIVERLHIDIQYYSYKYRQSKRKNVIKLFKMKVKVKTTIILFE